MLMKKHGEKTNGVMQRSGSHQAAVGELTRDLHRAQVLASVLGHVEDPGDVAAVASTCPRLRAVAHFAPLRLNIRLSKFMRTSEEGPFVHQGQLRAFLLGFSSVFSGAPSLCGTATVLQWCTCCVSYTYGIFKG